MKRFLPFLLLMAGPLLAQRSDSNTLNDAVRAFHGGDYETAGALFEVVLAKDPKNQAAQNYMRMINAQLKNSSALPATLKKIILPKVEFQEASPREALEHVSQLVQKQTDGKQSVNVVWMVPEGQERKVTLSLQNIPAFEALRYIGDAAGLQLEYDAYAVKIKPAPAATPAQ
jgi:hypothetical protein